MKTFKQFIKENWTKGWRPNKDAAHYKIHHDSEVHGHKVGISFRVDGMGKDKEKGGFKDKPIRVDFEVDNKMGGFGSDAKAGKHIYHHINKVVNRFMNKHKPSSMYFGTQEDKKGKLYQQYGKKVAKKYGGKTKTYDKSTYIDFKDDK